MKKIEKVLQNEEGSVLIVALIILVFITLMGITVTRTSDIDVQIAKNEKEYVQEFYVADSAWREAVQWLDTRAANPAYVNTTLFLSGDTGDVNWDDHAYDVRNYGDGDNDIFNITFDTSSKDGTLGTVEYWYKVASIPAIAPATAAGFGDQYRKYAYVLSSVADGTQRVDVTVTKVLRTGYQQQ